MVLSDRAEEILESLWIEIVENKKEKCDASMLKDDDSLKDLVDCGYVNVDNNQIKLTDSGKNEAQNCIRRHRLAERLFVDVLDLKGKTVHETSCRFEHMLHKGLDENVCTLLGHPKVCPHGKAIPEGRCCKDRKRMPKKLIMPLTQLEVNKKAKISYLQTQDRNILQKLIAMGALPKTEIMVTQKFPSYVFQIGKSQFTIDEELASCIYAMMT